MDFPQSRQPFYHEIQKTPIDLGKAALCIALEEYPDLNIDANLQQLDQYAQDIAEQLPQERYPLRVIKTVNSYLFETLKFRGNTDNYYDPKNSFLNHVLERRVGIPISLSVLYLELAKRLNFPMVGVGMPGHFLIRPDFEDAGIFVDAFNGGEVLFPEDCERRLSQIYGRPIPLQPEFLEPVSSRKILVRMLTNLKAIYIAQQEISNALAAIERILLLAPDSVLDLRDRGLIYYQSGQAIAASQDLERYLSLRPDAPDASTIQRILERLEQ